MEVKSADELFRLSDDPAAASFSSFHSSKIMVREKGKETPAAISVSMGRECVLTVLALKRT